MLPGVGPPVVCQRIADLVVSNGLTVVGCQQVLPLAVAIGISHLFGGSSQGVGCVGILEALENVAAAVVAIDPCFSGDGVICPCQPIQCIIFIGRCMVITGDGRNISVVVVDIGVSIHPIVPIRHLCAGSGIAGRIIGNGGIQHRAVTAFGDDPRHASVGIVGIAGTDIANGGFRQPIVLVVGVLGGIGVPIQGLGLRGEVVLVVIPPLHRVAVPLAGLLVAHKAALEVVEILGVPARGAVLENTQVAVVVVDIVHRVAVFVALAGGAAQGVVGVGNRVPIAIGGLSKIPIRVCGVGVANQRPLAHLHAVHQVERAIVEAVLRPRGRGDGVQQLPGVGVPHLGAALADPGGAEPTVVGVVGAGGVRLPGRLHPVQHTRLGVIAVGGRVPQSIRHGGELIPVGGIGRRGGNFLCLTAAAHRHLGVVAVGVVGKAGDHPLRAGGRADIVVAVVGVGLLGPAGQGDLGEVVVGVFIGGVLLLQIRDADDVPIGVIDIAVSEFLLE